MPKTLFENGADLLPAFVNAIFGQGAAGGHLHDGTDDDGHAPRIHLYNHADLTIQSLLATITTAYVTVQQIGTINWAMAGRLVFLFIPQIYGLSNSGSLRAALSGSPALPTPYQTTQYASCHLYDGGLTVPGQVRIGATQLDFYCLPAAVVGLKSTWGDCFETTGNKGVLDQTICYLCA